MVRSNVLEMTYRHAPVVLYLMPKAAVLPEMQDCSAGTQSVYEVRHMDKKPYLMSLDHCLYFMNWPERKNEKILDAVRDIRAKEVLQ